MEENSVNSVKKDKSNTNKTKNLTQGQILEILTQLFHDVEVSGIELDVEEDKTKKTVTVVIHGVDFVNGVLMLAN